MANSIQIHSSDNVAVALNPLQKNSLIKLAQKNIIATENIMQGHKVALKDIAQDSNIIKYGFPIGHAIKNIRAGQLVHTHNAATNLSAEDIYEYAPSLFSLAPAPPATFMGFLRPDGSAGIRNEIWIIPTVGCVNDITEHLARQVSVLVEGTSVDGVYAFPHPYGCSQMGEDHETTKKLLAALVKHPNAGGVLVVGLGCENNTLDTFKQELGQWDDSHVKFMVCQEEKDELLAGAALLGELIETASGFQRQPLPTSKLVVGMKCGGSDGLSGITANPTVGVFSNLLIAQGGSTILTEVPEMFGAESILMNRAKNLEIYGRIVDMVNQFKNYFVAHSQTVYENPSPGNKEGGITTLEDKSLGCVQKGGLATVVDVIPYAGRVKENGLTLLSGPGNDLVSATALAAAGAQIILFTTGRGTPFSGPVPTLKISSNTKLFEQKKNWIDFNAGTVAKDEPIPKTAQRLFDFVLDIASGTVHTKAEDMGYRGIAIFKDGVVL